jgi:adenosine deaminase CECR1
MFTLSPTHVQMPKGALLHAHLDATVDKEYLLELALREPTIHVRTPRVVTTSNSTTTHPEFRPFKEAQLSQCASVTDAEYPGDSWVPLHQARASFALGGPKGFDQWVLGAMSINPAEAYGIHNTVAKVRGLSTVASHVPHSQPCQIWQKFDSTFDATTVTKFIGSGITPSR